jgi:hypothetical protein
MQPSPLVLGGVCALAGLVGAGAARGQSPGGPRPEVPVIEYADVSAVRPASALLRPRAVPAVRLDAVPAGWREAVAKVVQQPTLTAHAGPEEFRAGLYEWLLEHPDRASLAWRRLGVPCTEITNLGQGRFGWTDGQGSEVTWRTVARGPEVFVWYAEGHAKPGPMLPVMPAKAVAVLRYTRRRGSDGQVAITHEVDVYLQTDSKAASLLTRLLGPAAPRLAEQGAEQLLLFFAGLSRYLDLHPDEVQTLLAK